ncbi:MAG: hypothetical protein NC299_16830 [Lachnospiraceae bacterium]|nr:hypothetical protein [Ruminococcus sp.]MCM1277000.1 hypothetical protein [Lachnospiraceae bacterium]
MADSKKKTAAKVITTAESSDVKVKDEISENDNISVNGGKLSLIDVAEVVNAVVDMVFRERDGQMEFAAEYYEVVLAYTKIAAFFPETGVRNDDIFTFFEDYIGGKYVKELEKMGYDPLAQYIDNAVNLKIEAKKRQIENPLVNSLTRLADTVNVLASKYVDDIENVGTADIKKFIEDFAKLSKKTNPQTVTDTVMKMRQKADEKRVDGKPSLKKQGTGTAKTKKSAKNADNGAEGDAT